MAGRYERVNAQDEDDSHNPSQPQRIPNSPPPSFRSRASSIHSLDRDNGRRNRVDSALADAFDSADDSEDEADDTQRLVRGTPQSSSAFTPSSGSSSTSGGRQGTAATAPSTQVTGVSQPSASGATAPPGNASTPFRIYGGGIQSDGVFSNIMAKPERGEEKEEQPPTYEQAAADAAPPYWETTILAPGLGGLDEVYIDGMPVGSFFSFAWNGMISVSIQPLIGFLLTYLLHSSHAAKNGSRSGLGITLIQYGFYMKGTGTGGAGAMGGAPSDGYSNPPDPNAHDFDPNSVGTGGGGGGDSGSGGSSNTIEGSEWIAYILMIVGWFVLIRAISDYIRARRHEQLVLQSPDRGLGVAIVAEGESPDRVV